MNIRMYWMYNTYFVFLNLKFFNKKTFLLWNFIDIKFLNNPNKITSILKNTNIQNISFKNFTLVENYFKYFNKIVEYKNNPLRTNILIPYSDISKNKFSVFKKINFFFMKKIVNLVSQITIENKNFLFLDSSYKNTFSFYNYIFSLKNLFNYKNFFFVNYKNFTLANYYYYYLSFMKKFNVVFLIILDFNHFSKFFKNLKNNNTPVSSLIPVNYDSSYIDYPIYVNLKFNLEKFLFFNLLAKIVFISFNFKTFSTKLNFLKLLYKFYLKSNFLLK